MQEGRNRDQRIVEAIESCRPHSGDVSEAALSSLADALAADPELDELYQRCQECDGRLAAAFHDVPVPAGLAARILTAVADASAAGQPDGGDVVTAEEPSAEEAVDAPPELLTVPQRHTRRRWLAAVAVVAGVAASVAIVLVNFQPVEPMSEQAMLSQAIDHFSREPELAGTLLTDDNELASYPFSRALSRFSGTRYRQVERFLGCEAVAYDMTSRLGVRATLYVVRSSGIDVAGLPAAPPANAAFRTLGCSSAAWCADGLVYVLVVEGDSKRSYDSFLPLPGAVT